MKNKHIIVGITGASGSLLGAKTLEMLTQMKVKVSLLITDTGRQVFKYEMGENLTSYLEKLTSPSIDLLDNNDFFAKIASGSQSADGMIIVPCSMGTLGKIAAGTSDHLLIRSADVMIKEQKKLVLLVREAPYNFIHLKNMQALCQPGIFIMPPVPQFYNHPKTIDQMTEQIIARSLKLLDIDHAAFQPWKGEK